MSTEDRGCKKRRLDCRDSENSATKPFIDFTTKWEELQQAHHFPGNLSTIFQHFVPKVGSAESNRLLQLALGLLFPETLLKIRDYLVYLRQNVTLQPGDDNPIPCWIYQTAIQSCQGHEPQTFNRRLLQWYVYNYIHRNVGLWDHTTKKARTVNHIIEQICQSGAQGAPLKDIKRRVYSWYDQGREWNDIVQAAGSDNILLFLPSKPIRPSLAPTACATKYRDLDTNQAQVVMNILHEVLPSVNFLGNEFLYETFLFHRPPDKLFHIEELSDNDIRNISIYSKPAFGLLTESRGAN